MHLIFFLFTKVIFYFLQQQIVSNSLETIRSIHGVFYEICKKSYLKIKGGTIFYPLLIAFIGCQTFLLSKKRQLKLNYFLFKKLITCGSVNCSTKLSETLLVWRITAKSHNKHVRRGLVKIQCCAYKK